MLIEFTVVNFRSFRERQTLNMVAAPLKSREPDLDKNNVIQVSGSPDLLSSAIISGPLFGYIARWGCTGRR